MKNTISKLFKLMVVAVFFNLGIPNVQSQDKAESLLIINVKGMENTDGKILLSIYRKGDNVMGKPFLQVSKVVKTIVSFVFDELPYGEYAAFVIHDENGNGKMDHFLGLPNEPMGYSNNWHWSLFTGMPNFKKTAFSFTSDNSKITIVVK